MMVKTKPNQKIHVDKLQTALDKLSQLESKPVVELTLRESIYFFERPAQECFEERIQL